MSVELKSSAIRPNKLQNIVLLIRVHTGHLYVCLVDNSLNQNSDPQLLLNRLFEVVKHRKLAARVVDVVPEEIKERLLVFRRIISFSLFVFS